MISVIRKMIGINHVPTSVPACVWTERPTDGEDGEGDGEEDAEGAAEPMADKLKAKLREPFEVPTTGAFWLHDDRFGGEQEQPAAEARWGGGTSLMCCGGAVLGVLGLLYDAAGDGVRPPGNVWHAPVQAGRT